jgi:hypothetical protein
MEDNESTFLSECLKIQYAFGLAILLFGKSSLLAPFFKWPVPG